MALERIGLARHVSVRCQPAITAWRIVATSDLLFALPRSHAAVLDAMWPMQLLDLPLPVEPGGRYLYWHQAAQADPGLGWLRGIIVELGRASGRERVGQNVLIPVVAASLKKNTSHH